MPAGIVLRDNAGIARREEAANALAMDNMRKQMARSGGGYSSFRPDPNSEFMRKMKAATVERAIQAVEAQKRADAGESVKVYSRKKDYYDLLGIDRVASAAEIRRAFRRLSLKFHPDKVAYKNEEERASAAKMFAELKEAHEVLSHEPTRSEYDQMQGVDDLLADKDFDLSDIEEALRRAQPGTRRPAPKYYEVDVTLEELYTGCVKTVEHTRVDSAGRGKEHELKISVPRGAVAGTEFVFRNMGDKHRGSSAGDVVCVLREVTHPWLLRHGDDLVYVASKEAQAHEMLVLLEVPGLFDSRLYAVGNTLGVRAFDEGDVASVTLPGYGMPRSNAERRSRFVNKEGKSSADAAGIAQDDEPLWEAEARKPMEGSIELSEGSEQESDAASDIDELDAPEEEEEEEEEEDEEALQAWGFAGSGAPKAKRAPRQHSRGDDMFGDLIVNFSARECRAERGQQPVVSIPSLFAAPSVLLLGPRPRPLPTLHSAEASRRLTRLREEIASWLCYCVLPDARRRCDKLRSSVRGALLVSLGEPPPSHAPTVESAEFCAEMVQQLAPGMAFRRLWLPLDLPLLDEDAHAIESAALVILHAALPTRQSLSEVPEVHCFEYVVNFRPGVRVRTHPSLDAPACAVLREGTRVRCMRRLGGWVEVEQGWALADGDELGLGELLQPRGEGHPRALGRSAAVLQRLEADLAAVKRHPALAIVQREHALRGLPLVACEDACSLLGAGKAGVEVTPFTLRALRGGASARAALERPPPPPSDYRLDPEGYKPPSAFEAGGNILNLDKVLKPKDYEAPPRPPPAPPAELSNLHALARQKRKRAGHDGIDGIGLTEDVLVCLSGGGGRFETPPEKCAVVSRRAVMLLEMIREGMGSLYEAHLAYYERLERNCIQAPHMRQFVEKRVDMLSVYTEKELNKWFESQGYSSPSLNKTDERRAVREREVDRVHKLQYMLQQTLHQLRLTVAQRCRGWTPDT